MSGFELMLVSEVAEELRESVRTTERKIDAGEIIAIDISRPGAKRRVLRVRRDDLDAYLDSKRGSKPPTVRRRRRKATRVIPAVSEWETA